MAFCGEIRQLQQYLAASQLDSAAVQQDSAAGQLLKRDSAAGQLLQRDSAAAARFGSFAARFVRGGGGIRTHATLGDPKSTEHYVSTATVAGRFRSKMVGVFFVQYGAIKHVQRCSHKIFEGDLKVLQTASNCVPYKDIFHFCSNVQNSPNVFSWIISEVIWMSFVKVFMKSFYETFWM